MTISQKTILYLLYALIVLLIIFSILASQDKNQEGFQKCIQDKCDRMGDKFCQKTRTINNCCMGATGKLTNQGCVFN